MVKEVRIEILEEGLEGKGILIRENTQDAGNVPNLDLDGT